MQHPDEGTIHAWLDGALPGEQARELERHLSGCAACQAQVAAARGITAAASRILAALDEVPADVVPRAGVSPARPRRAWWKRPVVRIAATVLIVATGTVMVTRDWATARPSAGERIAPVLVAVPGAASEAEAGQASAASAPGELPATAVPPAGQPAQENAASRLLERDRELAAGLADRQAATGRGQVEPAPSPLRPEPERFAVKAESGVGAPRIANARTAEQDAAAKAREVPPAGQAVALESAETRREASGARTRSAPSAPSAAAEQAPGAVAQKLSHSDAAGCYAVAIRGAADERAPALPARLRLIAPGAVVADADAARDVAAAVILDVPFAGDSARVGWWVSAGDSVVVRLPGAGSATRIAFPIAGAEPRVGGATRVDMAARSWSGAVEVRRISCPDEGLR